MCGFEKYEVVGLCLKCENVQYEHVQYENVRYEMYNVQCEVVSCSVDLRNIKWQACVCWPATTTHETLLQKLQL